MAHTLNGYIYHTKYDTFGNLERGTCQSTGDNVLALTWALANAEELDNPEVSLAMLSCDFFYNIFFYSCIQRDMSYSMIIWAGS